MKNIPTGEVWREFLATTENRAYVAEFPVLQTAAPANLQVMNSVQLTSDGEICGIGVCVWNAAGTADLDFHTSFRITNVNANISITKAFRNNPGAADHIRIRSYLYPGGNAQNMWILMPGVKCKAMDEIQVSVRLEPTCPAGVAGVTVQVVLYTRENAAVRV